MSETAADILIDRLTAWNVTVVFGLPGHGIDGLMEALRKRQRDIRFIHAVHEMARTILLQLSVCRAPLRGRSFSYCC
jgi:pyruvate dehydrogenase (quinone)